MSHYSGKYSGSNGNGSYSRSRDSDRGHDQDRDKEWGRDWRNDREPWSGSRDRDKQRQMTMSPSGSGLRYSDYNRSRGQQQYYPARPADDHGPRYSKFSNLGNYGKYNYRDRPFQSGYPSTTVMRENDLQRCHHEVNREPGFDANHYDAQYQYSGFPKTDESVVESSATVKGKNPMDNPLFKAALDTCIMNMKTKGDYDLIRKECMSDIDTKASFINLQDRVKSTVDTFLGSQVFTKDFDKVKAREMMRKRILNAPYFEKGIESVVDQILLPKINDFIRPKIEAEVYRYLNSDKSAEAEAVPSPPSSNLTNNENEAELVDTETKIQKKPVYLNEGSENVPSSSDKGLPNDGSMNFVPVEGTRSLVECDKKVSSSTGSSNSSPETHHNEHESTPDQLEEDCSQVEQKPHGENEIGLAVQMSPEHKKSPLIEPGIPSGAPPSPPPPECPEPPLPPGINQYGYAEDDDDKEPLQSGEEAESHLSHLEKCRPPSPKPVAVKESSSPGASVTNEETTRTIKEDVEVDVQEEEPEVEDDSDEESPMFEKISDVSPPRVVMLENSDLVQELSKELIGEKTDDVKPVDEHKKQFYFDENVGDEECKYLEPTPMYDYKVSYYKRFEKKAIK